LIAAPEADRVSEKGPEPNDENSDAERQLSNSASRAALRPPLEKTVPGKEKRGLDSGAGLIDVPLWKSTRY
jgi:hypothetical protein